MLKPKSSFMRGDIDIKCQSGTLIIKVLMLTHTTVSQKCLEYMDW